MGIVNADLPAGGDAVLTLPQLDQPAFSTIAEGDGFTVHNHVEEGRSLVVKPAIACFPLPAVHPDVSDAIV